MYHSFLNSTRFSPLLVSNGHGFHRLIMCCGFFCMLLSVLSVLPGNVVECHFVLFSWEKCKEEQATLATGRGACAPPWQGRSHRRCTWWLLWVLASLIPTTSTGGSFCRCPPQTQEAPATHDRQCIFCCSIIYVPQPYIVLYVSSSNLNDVCWVSPQRGPFHTSDQLHFIQGILFSPLQIVWVYPIGSTLCLFHSQAPSNPLLLCHSFWSLGLDSDFFYTQVHPAQFLFFGGVTLIYVCMTSPTGPAFCI